MAIDFGIRTSSSSFGTKQNGYIAIQRPAARSRRKGRKVEEGFAACGRDQGTMPTGETWCDLNIPQGNRDQNTGIQFLSHKGFVTEIHCGILFTQRYVLKNCLTGSVGNGGIEIAA